MFDEIDVSGWEEADEEFLGTKPKRWLREPVTGTYWLMKDRTDNERADGSTYAKGDDWAERIASAIAEVLRLPAARTELVVRTDTGGTTFGVASRSVLADRTESLVLGNELLAEAGVEVGERRRRSGYTLAAVRESLVGVDPPDEIQDGLRAWEVLCGYLVLDALIGNTDRHHENWGVIDRGGRRRLAPTFDHASSLGFLLDDPERERRLSTADRQQAPEAWADRARSKFEGRPRLLDVAIEALASVDGEVRCRWLDACGDSATILEPIDRVPNHRMTPTARDFARRVLERNRSRLMSHPIATVVP